MGWYYYLEGKISFPFKARCIARRSISPLQKGEEVTVTGMADEDDCMSEMFVTINWMDRALGIPLVQLQGIDVDEDTEEAIGDWYYWMEQGNQLC
jgi:hypothetical protein